MSPLKRIPASAALPAGDLRRHAREAGAATTTTVRPRRTGPGASRAMKSAAYAAGGGSSASASASALKTYAEARCIVELIDYLAFSERRLVASAPRGDRRPILVIPGFLCSDLSTWPLRRFLRKIGYRSFPWKQGINWGPRPGVRTRLLNRLGQLRDRYGQPVTLIGWSLGGVYARELACIRPEQIREVITLGSPLHGNVEAAAVWTAFRWLNRRHLSAYELRNIEFPQPAYTPCLSIFTEEDGIVPWQFCVPQRGRAGGHAGVQGSHIGLVANPEVMRLLGEHLGHSAPCHATGLARAGRIPDRRKKRRSAQRRRQAPIPAAVGDGSVTDRRP
jgi:pimeloyl-ACP methyl ester carboxylesterase